MLSKEGNEGKEGKKAWWEPRELVPWPSRKVSVRVLRFHSPNLKVTFSSI